MFRIQSRLAHHVTSKLVRGGSAHSVRRQLSAQAGAGGGVSKLLIAAGGVTGGVGGLVGYSALDVENRKSVQNNIPGSSLVIGTFLGPLEEAAPAKPVELPEIPALPEAAPAEEKVEEAPVLEEVAAEPAVEVEAAAEPVVEVEAAAEPVAAPEPVVEPEPVAAPEPVVEPELVAEPEPVQVAEPEPVAEPEVVSEPASEPVPDPTPEPEVAPAVVSSVEVAVEAAPEVAPVEAEAEVVVTETIVESGLEVAPPPADEAIELVAEVAPAAEVVISETTAAPAEAEVVPEVASEPAAPEVATEVVTVPVTAEPLKADAASDQSLLIIATSGSVTIDAIELENQTEAVSVAATSLGEAEESAKLETRLAANELAEEVENATLNQLLDDLSHTSQKNLTAALSAAEDASITIRRHAERAYQAIDAGSSEEKKSLFAEVAELAKKRAELVQAAEKGIATTLESLRLLSEQIAIGRSSSLTKNNNHLINADEKMGELKYAVDKVQSLLTNAGRDAKVVSDYKDLVEAGRQQFEEEVKCLLPEVRLGESGDKLSPDELNLLIAHAHRKVLQLQKQIAGQQSLEVERFKEALANQREEDEVALQARIESELANQEQLLDIEMRRQMAHIKEDLEAEMRTQLKRQAAAHSDHLTDVLTVQKYDIETKWANRLQDEILTEKDHYHKSVGTMQGKLHGLKAAMVARSDVDKAAFAARELWLACDSLRTALKLGNESATTWEETPKPLNEQVAAVREAAGDNNPFVSAVLSAISGEAVSRGVYNYDALKERFIKVERICKRVSMIGDNGGSLLRYLMSYVQSFLVLNNFEYLPTNELKNQEVDLNALDTYDILNRARYCLDKDDLLLAVQYLNLLDGEPRNVASNWMKEARLSLETQQASEALMAHAAATAVKTL